MFSEVMALRDLGRLERQRHGHLVSTSTTPRRCSSSRVASGCPDDLVVALFTLIGNTPELTNHDSSRLPSSLYHIYEIKMFFIPLPSKEILKFSHLAEVCLAAELGEADVREEVPASTVSNQPYETTAEPRKTQVL